MEDNKQTVETETTATKEVETTVETGKTFTQEEFDEALLKAVQRKTKGMPSKEELEKFKEWQDQQKTESEKQVEREKQYSKVEAENDELKRINSVLINGVKPDDVDYVVYKVSKMEGDFEDNLKSFLQANTKFTEKESVSKATGTTSKGTAVEEEDGVTAILKAKHPELF